jgi:hypothetical protein
VRIFKEKGDGHVTLVTEKMSNDHLHDHELEDDGIQWGRSGMCIRCARVVIRNRVQLRGIGHTSIV